MVVEASDPGVKTVVENIGVMVASEGGSLELLELGEDSMKVRYTLGYNEECPECVPTTESVHRFLVAALQIHAPHITNVEVVEEPRS